MKKFIFKINVDTKKPVKVGTAYLIDVPMYRCGVEILFKESTLKVEKHWGSGVNYGGKARDYLNESRRVMITFTSDKPKLSNVVHEFCHATQFILKNSGHDYYHQDGDEPFAYLLTYLVEEYLKKK